MYLVNLRCFFENKKYSYALYLKSKIYSKVSFFHFSVFDVFWSMVVKMVFSFSSSLKDIFFRMYCLEVVNFVQRKIEQKRTLLVLVQIVHLSKFL